MQSLFICYPKCTTCQKARSFLNEYDIPYTERNIKEQNPTREELTTWCQKSGLPLKKFFNTSGLLYKSFGLSKKLAAMGEEEMLDLLSTEGMLVKRPILVHSDFVFVGFKEEQWKMLK